MTDDPDLAAQEAAKALAPEDALCLGIGRVARLHVMLDNALRTVHNTLASPSLAIVLASRISSTDTLAENCRTMMRKADVSEDVLAGSAVALDAAKDANILRNQVVHDWWMRDLTANDNRPSEVPRWNTLRRKAGELHALPSEPRDLAFVDEGQVRIRRATWRVNALNWALWQTLPFFRDSGDHREEDLARWVDVMHDRFVLNPDNSIQPLPGGPDVSTP